MRLSIEQNDLKSVLSTLKTSNDLFMKDYPGESEKRQPVHTLYGGAQLFSSKTIQKIGSLAVKNFNEYAPDAKNFGKLLGISPELSQTVHERVAAKLEREAVEDFRIDFEDGYGHRPDEEEDTTAEHTAKECAKGFKEKTLSPFIGIRIKPFTEELKTRSIRTLDIFITTLLSETNGKLPDGFVVTLPKITQIEHVEALVQIFELLEKKNDLPAGLLKMEFMVETPQSLFTPSGECALPKFLKAAKGRCVAAHFGTYDYTASISITADQQVMDHPACDFARSVMQVTLAGTGIWLSDGATNVMPVGDKDTVHRAWKTAFDHTRHSLRHALYQGWDLHPAQIPIRYAALYSFFLEGLESASVRLKNFVEQAAKATLVGEIFDDAATGQGLLNYFLRSLNCGAITEDELHATGLTIEQVRTRSFKEIIKNL